MPASGRLARPAGRAVQRGLPPGERCAHALTQQGARGGEDDELGEDLHQVHHPSLTPLGKVLLRAEQVSGKGGAGQAGDAQL